MFEVGEIVRIAKESDLGKFGYHFDKSYQLYSKGKEGDVSIVKFMFPLLGKLAIIVDSIKNNYYDDDEEVGRRYYLVGYEDFKNDKELNRDIINFDWPTDILQSTGQYYTKFKKGDKVVVKSLNWIKENWATEGEREDLSFVTRIKRRSAAKPYFIFADDFELYAGEEGEITSIEFDLDFSEFLYNVKTKTPITAEDAVSLSENLLVPDLRKAVINHCKNKCIMDCDECDLKEIIEGCLK